MLLFFIQISWVMEYWLPWKPKKKIWILSQEGGKNVLFLLFCSTKLFLC